MRPFRIYLSVSFAILVVFMTFSGCIHETGQINSADSGSSGLYIYEVMLVTDAPVTNFSLMVPLPYLDGVSTVADAIERGDGMSMPAGWNIMIIDGDDATFLKIDAPEAGKCDAVVSSGKNAYGCMQVIPAGEVTPDAACIFRIVVPARISVPGGTPAINNPLLYPKTGMEVLKGDDGSSLRPVSTLLFPAVSYRSLVYAGYNTSESTRLYGYIIISGVIPEQIGLSGYSDPGCYKTVYTDEITLDLTGSQQGWHPVNGTVIYRI
jgi:hypothetical protein